MGIDKTLSTVETHKMIQRGDVEGDGRSIISLFLMQKTYATALYDNIADSPEELAFRRGDILEVLERDTNNMVGWWLCTLRDRKVIFLEYPTNQPSSPHDVGIDRNTRFDTPPFDSTCQPTRPIKMEWD